MPRKNLFSLTFILRLTLTLTFPLIFISLLTPYFHSTFMRYGVYAGFADQYPETYLWEEFYNVLEYIRPPFNTQLDPDFFSSADIYHMQDVRNLFILIWITSLTSATCLALQRLVCKKKVIVNVARQRKLNIPFVIALLVIGSLLLLTWDSSFIAFHQLLFPGNNYWQLDPATSNLIKFLPGQIFQELLLIYIGLIIVVEFFIRKLASLAGLAQLARERNHL